MPEPKPTQLADEVKRSFEALERDLPMTKDNLGAWSIALAEVWSVVGTYQERLEERVSANHHQ